MQKLAEVCIKRPVFATMLVMAFVVIGAASWMRLGVDRFPTVDLPTVSVARTARGIATRAEQVCGLMIKAKCLYRSDHGAPTPTGDQHRLLANLTR